MLKKQKEFSLSALIRHFFLAWLIALSLAYLVLPREFKSLSTAEALSQISLPGTVGITLLLTLGLSILSRYKSIEKPERYLIAAVFALYAGMSMFSSFNWPYLIVCLLVLLVLAVYSKFGWDSSGEVLQEAKPARKSIVWLSAAVSVVYFLFLSISTLCRIYSFDAPSYDFSIFAQMFYYMKETGLPMTTIERSSYLSHMQIHVSPIFYLLLPFYRLFPFPGTLQVLQAAVLTSAVIPMWMICKNHGFSDWQRMLLCFILLLFPAFSGGAYFDIHENCFLTPLILWLFYAVERKNLPLTLLFTVLTLAVKEDAAVYTAVIGLWMTLGSLLHYKKGEKKQLLSGLTILFISLVWFYAAISYLAARANGVMIYRYDNFFYGDTDSLASVLLAVILLPLKVVYECVKSHKIPYILQTLLPLCLLPLATRKYERYVLLIPYILFNLMAAYELQSSIFFQYSFGSAAFLLYLSVLTLGDIKPQKRRIRALAAAGIMSALSYGYIILPEALSYPVRAIENHSLYSAAREALREIPRDSSVAGSMYFTALVSQRRELYDLEWTDRQTVLSCDYVILGSGEKNYDEIYQLLLDNNYQIAETVPDMFIILRK